MVTTCTHKTWKGLSSPPHLEYTLVYGGNDLSYINWPYSTILDQLPGEWKYCRHPSGLWLTTGKQQCLSNHEEWLHENFCDALVLCLYQVQHRHNIVMIVLHGSSSPSEDRGVLVRKNKFLGYSMLQLPTSINHSLLNYTPMTQQCTPCGRCTVGVYPYYDSLQRLRSTHAL